MISFRSDNERIAARPETVGGDRDCSRGEWCASASRERLEDGTTRRAPAATYRAFCDADRDIIGQCLAALPATYARLAASIGVHVAAETPVRTPFGPGVPIRCDIDEIQRLIVDAVLSWHERVADVARLSVPDTAAWRARALGPYAPALLAASVPVLAAHLDALLGLLPEPMVRPSCSPVTRSGTVLSVTGDTALVEAGGSDAGLEVLRVDYLARSALLETNPAPVRLIGVPCRGCDKMALRKAAPAQHDGDTQWWSECALCRDTMDEAEFRNWARAWARHYEARLTPAMVAAS